MLGSAFCFWQTLSCTVLVIPLVQCCSEQRHEDVSGQWNPCNLFVRLGVCVAGTVSDGSDESHHCV